jgi:hypothetical protein
MHAKRGGQVLVHHATLALFPPLAGDQGVEKLLEFYCSFNEFTGLLVAAFNEW